MLWKYPATNVTLDSAEQIGHVDIKGDWLLNRNARQLRLELQNGMEITMICYIH